MAEAADLVIAGWTPQLQALEHETPGAGAPGAATGVRPCLRSRAEALGHGRAGTPEIRADAGEGPRRRVRFCLPGPEKALAKPSCGREPGTPLWRPRRISLGSSEWSDDSEVASSSDGQDSLESDSSDDDFAPDGARPPVDLAGLLRAGQERLARARRGQEAALPSMRARSHWAVQDSQESGQGGDGRPLLAARPRTRRFTHTGAACGRAPFDLRSVGSPKVATGTGLALESSW
mmetsp:Transcript_129237/g.359893  ORF Transcript_129237/g.359893 Transcript_129237/m.359893 type:complete len:234 (-) Transcript_129237:125-826(-)